MFQVMCEIHFKLPINSFTGRNGILLRIGSCACRSFFPILHRQNRRYAHPMQNRPQLLPIRRLRRRWQFRQDFRLLPMRRPPIPVNVPANNPKVPPTLLPTRSPETLPLCSQVPSVPPKTAVISFMVNSLISKLLLSSIEKLKGQMPYPCFYRQSICKRG